jgi:hypothetical protein
MHDFQQRFRTWLDWRGGGLPWLSPPAIALGILLICFPFFLVDVPPLIDVPGHMGAAAIEAAGPDSPLGKYLGWKWVFTLNIGGDVLMKVLGEPLGVLAAGWWSTVIATALFAGGCLATVRVVNPRGGHGAAWALMWVFSFPLLTGFLNYILGTGVSLCAFAAAVALERRPRDRAGLLVVAQPLAMLCHAIGGLLLAVLVAANAFGREVDALPQGWWRLRAGAACWPRTTGRRRPCALSCCAGRCSPRCSRSCCGSCSRPPRHAASTPGGGTRRASGWASPCATSRSGSTRSPRRRPISCCWWGRCWAGGGTGSAACPACAC